jgi:hypothetical protein
LREKFLVIVGRNFHEQPLTPDDHERRLAMQEPSAPEDVLLPNASLVDASQAIGDTFD